MVSPSEQNFNRLTAGSHLAIGYPSAGSNNGDILSETISAAAPFSATQNFTYDAYNRPWTASEGSAWPQTYGYDAYGNRWVNGPPSRRLPRPRRAASIPARTD
ncbi:hypothetical protein SBA4_5720002 [Candidatus Sulfopaludibacter sp. SbA4]|nr:hypothetical protein SBA4_5720002 [Candidatus Sulfopaludibacter sp. SbA4]